MIRMETGIDLTPPFYGPEVGPWCKKESISLRLSRQTAMSSPKKEFTRYNSNHRYINFINPPPYYI